MKMLNEMEMSLVSGGILCYTPPTHEERVRIDAIHRLEVAEMGPQGEAEDGGDCGYPDAGR